MNWIFVVVRDNSVEQVKVFDDFSKGVKFTNDFIKSIDPDFHGDFPIYNQTENYRNGDLTIGLYKEFAENQWRYGQTATNVLWFEK